MSNPKYKRLPESAFRNIETLVGMSDEELRSFSYNNLRHFFRVTLWDRSKLCAGCNKPIDSIQEATLDHILPRIYGGRTRLSNLQLMHQTCNRKKSATLPERIPYNATVPVKSRAHNKLTRRVLPIPKSGLQN